MMSGPSSEGRLSFSSTSSHTLNSRYSETHADNGEGSSAQRPSIAGSRQNSGGRRSVTESSPRDSASPLSTESIGEQDFAHRRHRNRKSGGFLLDSTLPSGPATRQHRTSAYLEDAKGKRSSRHQQHQDGSGRHVRIQGGNAVSSNRSPLSREVIMADRGGGQDIGKMDLANQDGAQGLQIAKIRKNGRDELISDQDAQSEGKDAQTRPAMDPTQLVHMALNLSESRRRNLGAGQLIAPQDGESRRITSMGSQHGGGSRNAGTGGSLRQYLNEQRRVSRNISPVGGRGSPSGSRYVSGPMPRSMSMSMQGQDKAPSQATLARRDKARAYIELQLEYIRLLELLPPLKPDSSAPGNFIVTANNVPGSPHAHLTRIPSYANERHGLGRVYNPLQYIRNRRSRARNRLTLDHTPPEFSDIETVRDWVDQVDRESKSPTYRQQDGVSLPKVDQSRERAEVPSKRNRPLMGWVFTPEELIADAYWLEQGDNKTLIEDRHGRKIFPPKEPQKQDFLQPRSSKDYPDKRRKSWVEGLPGIAAGEHTAGEESDQASERGRKRRLLPAFRAESPKHKKHGWRSSRPHSGSYSDETDTDSDTQKQQSKKTRRIIDVNNNTGPLELRIKEILEKEAKAKESKSESPGVDSPDTPDKWGLGHDPIRTDKVSRDSMDATVLAGVPAKNISPHQDLKMPPRSRTTQTLYLDPINEPRSSIEAEDLDSTAPSTPLLPKSFLPHIGSDLSPPPSRGGSIKISKKSRFDLFRSDESTKSHKLEPDSAGTDKYQTSRQTSEELHEGGGFGNAILAAPGAVKSLLTHKKNESVSSLNSPDTYRKDHKESKDPREPPSAVTRFFKGVKNEGSKVGEMIFRRDRPADDSDTDSNSSKHSQEESDEDEDGNTRKKVRPSTTRNTTSTAPSIASKKASRYHLDLPTFRSSNQNDQDNASISDSHLSDDHVSRQVRARANSRSTRFDKLAPPPLDMSATSSPEVSRTHSPDAVNDRLSKVLARPGGVGQGGYPITSLAHHQFANSSQRQRSASRPKLEKRQWSITDDNGNIIHRKDMTNAVTQADLARIRALLLCSGVKAREIARRAQEQRPEPPRFLKKAAQAANASLIPVPKKEEHVLAARMLVQNLESSTQALHASAQQFRDSTIKELASQISNLKSRIEADLFPRVLSSGDEAVRITSEVSGSAPLTVKQISDEIDAMIRIRRRRMRWMRRVGWMLVEWMLLGLMWGVWLVVVILGSVKKIFGFVLAFVRWLFWM